MKAKKVRRALDPGWTRRLQGLYVTTANNLSGVIQTAFKTAQKNLPLDKLARAIESGKIDQVITHAKIGKTLLGDKEVQREIHAAMNAASDLEKTTIETSTGKVINPLGRNMKRIVDLQTARRITAIDGVTRDAIRGIIQDALKTGLHPYDTANRIKDMVGLTRPMAGAVEKYRLRLIADGLEPDRIEGLVGKYTERLRGVRAENIARTETMQALNGGRAALRQELMESGVLPPNQTQTWRTARDERVCDICGPLDGVSMPFGELFPGAETDAPPAHPNCRCVVTLDDMSKETEGEQ